MMCCLPNTFLDAEGGFPIQSSASAEILECEGASFQRGAMLSARRCGMRAWQSAAVLLILVVLGQTPLLTQASGSLGDEARSLMAQIRTASLEGDSEKVSSLMTDDYVHTDISGHVQDKQTWLREYFKPLAELIKAGKFRWEVYDRKELQFRVYGDTVVVLGDLQAKGSGAKWVPQSHTWAADPSATFSGTLRFTHVYVKRNGRWLLAALHNAIPVSSTPAK
jgi:uncharacterized protein (TIGR02246 family)